MGGKTSRTKHIVNRLLNSRKECTPEKPLKVSALLDKVWAYKPRPSSSRQKTGGTSIIKALGLAQTGEQCVSFGHLSVEALLKKKVISLFSIKAPF